jgi:sigma-B regulation protein RsbU (phosphoserine phosphatase)
LSEDFAIPLGDPVEDLDDLYENAPCGYISLRLGGRIFKANATFARWLGFSGDELAGKRFHDLLGVAGRMYWETHVAPVIALRGHFDEVALDVTAKSGERVPMLVNAAAKHGADGSHTFTRLTLFNATERRRYERDLRASIKEAEAARHELRALHMQVEASLVDERATSALREQFIAVLGHDLRNPLSGIGGGVELMMREGLSDERRGTIGRMVLSSVARMAGLIEDVMDFARGRLGGGLTLARDADEPLEPMLRQVIAELRTAVPERDIDVGIALTEPVECDRRRIAQMVSNLLGNALTHGDAADPIRFEAVTEDGWLRISIANSGKPIPAAMLDRIFEPFARGEHRPSLQGLGLGLYISHQSAVAHGGTLSVVSTEAETRFTFSMKLAPDNPISRAMPLPA